MMVVDIQQEPFQASVPRLLFQTDPAILTNDLMSAYDVAPNGRFLMIKAVGMSTERERPVEIVLSQNWFEELKRLVPIP